MVFPVIVLHTVKLFRLRDLRRPPSRHNGVDVSPHARYNEDGMHLMLQQEKTGDYI
jgi:hypothetical protein